MEITTIIDFSEDDIKNLVKAHLCSMGYASKEINIRVSDPENIPHGATAGDCVAIEVKVEKIKNINHGKKQKAGKKNGNQKKQTRR